MFTFSSCAFKHLLTVAVRLSEAHYTVKHVGEADGHYDELNRLFGFTGTENSCFPVGILENFKQSNMMEGPNKSYYGRESRESMEESTLSGHSIFIDSEISDELRTKVSLILFLTSFIFGYPG